MFVQSAHQKLTARKYLDFGIYSSKLTKYDLSAHLQPQSLSPSEVNSSPEREISEPGIEEP
jgi:hypothetical protein